MQSKSEDIISVTDIPTIRILCTDRNLTSGSPSSEVALTPMYPKNDVLLDKISIIQGDITKIACDCIVNATNSNLRGNIGVNGAIHQAAGPNLLRECRRINFCQEGEAEITGGYDLPALHVIHTAGPTHSFTRPDLAKSILESCYQNCLELAVHYNLLTIAFCGISTGAKGYPPFDAALVAMGTARRFLETEHGSRLDRIIFVAWDTQTKTIYENLVPVYFPH